jgi:sugar fermentation stimulation protein A
LKFSQPLIPGILIKRYKRFLADIELNTGEFITAHCPNSGSMKSCVLPGWDAMVSWHDKPNRKYKYTWEMVHNGICWIGVNTGIPNQIAAEAIREERIPELEGYDEIKREVRYGKNSRIDLLLKKENKSCYVEVKNVTLVEEDGNYYFPDSVTARGRKHLHELQDMVDAGHRAVMLFVIQRNDGHLFKPAAHIDAAYAQSLQEVHRGGVEILVYRAEVHPDGIAICEPVPWRLE